MKRSIVRLWRNSYEMMNWAGLDEIYDTITDTVFF